MFNVNEPIKFIRVPDYILSTTNDIFGIIIEINNAAIIIKMRDNKIIVLLQDDIDCIKSDLAKFDIDDIVKFKNDKYVKIGTVGRIVDIHRDLEEAYYDIEIGFGLNLNFIQVPFYGCEDFIEYIKEDK